MAFLSTICIIPPRHPPPLPSPPSREVSLSFQSILFFVIHSFLTFLFPFFGTQSSAFPSQSAMHMMENSEKTPDEKPSPEQNRHPSRGSNLPLFTNETRTIIWGLQARAVQVILHEEVISQGIIVTSNNQRLRKCVLLFYN